MGLVCSQAPSHALQGGLTAEALGTTDNVIQWTPKQVIVGFEVGSDQRGIPPN